jgi:hypothetical protein
MVKGIDGQRGTVALLDADPDLANGLEPVERDEAGARAVATVIEIDSARWDPIAIAPEGREDWLGLLLLDGLMIRQVTVGKRSACELFGPGDVIRPWDAGADYDPLAIAVAWLVLEPTRLAVLDTGSRCASLAGRVSRAGSSAASSSAPAIWLSARRWRICHARMIAC